MLKQIMIIGIPLIFGALMCISINLKKQTQMLNNLVIAVQEQTKVIQEQNQIFKYNPEGDNNE